MVSKVLALTCMAGLAGMANARSLVSMLCCLHCCTEPTPSRVAICKLHAHVALHHFTDLTVSRAAGCACASRLLASLLTRVG